MTMNLFSSFNLLSWIKEIYLMSMIMVILIMPMKFWMISSKSMKLMMSISKPIYKQLKTMMSKTMNMNMLMIMSTMTMILLLNTLSLFPYIYSWTALPQFTLPLATSMWLGIYMKKMKNITPLLAHMLPMGTPKPLIPLMIVIESLSTLIQPITLSIRLMANITAGHILLTLISSAYNLKFSMMIMMTQMLMSILEVCVSLIQAFVFSMLLTMFNK